MFILSIEDSTERNSDWVSESRKMKYLVCSEIALSFPSIKLSQASHVTASLSVISQCHCCSSILIKQRAFNQPHENRVVERTESLGASRTSPDWSLLGFPVGRLLTLCRSRVECPHSRDVGGKCRVDRGSAEAGDAWCVLHHPVLATTTERDYYSPPSTITLTVGGCADDWDPPRGGCSCAVAAGFPTLSGLSLLSPFAGKRSHPHPQSFLSFFPSFDRVFSLNFSQLFVLLAPVETRSWFIPVGLEASTISLLSSVSLCPSLSVPNAWMFLFTYPVLLRTNVFFL